MADNLLLPLVKAAVTDLGWLTPLFRLVERSGFVSSAYSAKEIF